MFGSKHVALKELRSINYYMCLLPAHLLSLRATLNASGYCNADILSLSLFILIQNHLYIYDSHIPNAVADSESNGSAGNGLAL